MRVLWFAFVLLSLTAPVRAERLLARLSGTWADGIAFRVELRAGKSATRLKIWESAPGKSAAKTLVVDVPDFLPLPDFAAAKDVPDDHRVILELAEREGEPVVIAGLINDYSIYGGSITVTLRPVDGQITVAQYGERSFTEQSSQSCAVALLTGKVKVNDRNRRAPDHPLEEKAALLWHVGRATALGYCP